MKNHRTVALVVFPVAMASDYCLLRCSSCFVLCDTQFTSNSTVLPGSLRFLVSPHHISLVCCAFVLALLMVSCTLICVVTVAVRLWVHLWAIRPLANGNLGVLRTLHLSATHVSRFSFYVSSGNCVLRSGLFL